MRALLFFGVALGVILLALNFNTYSGSKSLEKATTPASTTATVAHVAQQLHEAVRSASVKLQKAAVGYNTNLDLVCSAVSLMNQLHLEPQSLQPFRSSEKINSLEEFGSTFGTFFVQGSAAERAASNEKVWKEILAPLQQTNYEQCSVHPGGNAALIANRLADLNVSVLLGGPVGDGLAPLLHPSIITQQKYHANLPQQEIPFPEVEDEVHLILEYRAGETWNPKLASPRANRFIISHDLQNSQLLAIEGLHESLSSFEPEVLIVAGSHLLESLTEEEREQRLTALERALKSVPEHILVHLEIAGVGDESFLEQMARKLLPLVDSVGLNEQELGALYRCTGGNKYQAKDFVVPTVQIAQDAVDHLLRLPYVRHGRGSHEITRVHLHYLSFHLIAQWPVDGTAEKWSGQRARDAVVAAALAPTIQACGTEGKLPSYESLHLRPTGLPEGKYIDEWENNGIQYWASTVLVCNVPLRTVGLGDCISATGLAYHYS